MDDVFDRLFERGCYRLEFLDVTCRAFLARRRVNDVDRQEVLRAYYFRYHILKVLRKAVLAGAFGLETLTRVLGFALELLPRLGVLDVKWQSDYRVTDWVGAQLRYEALGIDEARTSRLGNRSSCALGSSMVLGESVAGRVPTVYLQLTVPATIGNSLVIDGRSLCYLLWACELAFPVHLNYKLLLAFDPDDRRFVLESVTDGPQTAVQSGVRRLGLTTKLTR